MHNIPCLTLQLTNSDTFNLPTDANTRQFRLSSHTTFSWLRRHCFSHKNTNYVDKYIYGLLSYYSVQIVLVLTLIYNVLNVTCTSIVYNGVYILPVKSLKEKEFYRCYSQVLRRALFGFSL